MRSPQVIDRDTRYLCYSDEVLPKVDPWEILPAFQPYPADRARMVRVHKMLSHLFTDTEYSIWMDGNFELGSVDPTRLVNGYLNDKGVDIAVFSHHGRQCLFDEGEHCAEMNFDDPVILRKQMSDYADAGFGRRKGLYACGIILRRHTEKIKQLNHLWWEHILKYGRRDQISFPFVANQLGVKIGVIPGTIVSSDEFIYRKHGPWKAWEDNAPYLEQMEKAAVRRDYLWSLCPKRD